MAVRGKRCYEAKPAVAARWAVLDVDAGDALPEIGDRLGGRGARYWRGCLKCGACLGEQCPLAAVGDEAVVADAIEAAGQHVKGETAKKLLRGEIEEFAPIAMGVVFVAKAHHGIFEGHEPLVGERHAMGVAPEILEHLLRSGEGALGVDDPSLLTQIGKQAVLYARVAERRGAGREREASVAKRLSERFEELAAEYDREGFHRKQEPTPGSNPGARCRERPCGHQRMHMQVLGKGLAPGVKHERRRNLATEPSGVLAELDEGLGGRSEQHRVERTRVALGERVYLVRKRKDEVVVRHRKEFDAPRGEPTLLRARLALRTVPVAAGVVDVAPCAAGIALAKLAPEGRRAAALDRAQRLVLHRTKPMRGAKRRAVGADDVGQFRFAAARARLARKHDGLSRLERGPVQQFQRRRRSR